MHAWDRFTRRVLLPNTSIFSRHGIDLLVEYSFQILLYFLSTISCSSFEGTTRFLNGLNLDKEVKTTGSTTRHQSYHGTRYVLDEGPHSCTSYQSILIPLTYTELEMKKS
ncbi:unnamed protein product [Amoebophrya sp. A25]|nr:unnamed protein product [Amoebophrya sp. A25]|eukprot:GSA25T00012780001.1